MISRTTPSLFFLSKSQKSIRYHSIMIKNPCDCAWVSKKHIEWPRVARECNSTDNRCEWMRDGSPTILGRSTIPCVGPIPLVFLFITFPFYDECSCFLGGLATFRRGRGRFRGADLHRNKQQRSRTVVIDVFIKDQRGIREAVVGIDGRDLIRQATIIADVVQWFRKFRHRIHP